MNQIANISKVIKAKAHKKSSAELYYYREEHTPNWFFRLLGKKKTEAGFYMISLFFMGRTGDELEDTEELRKRYIIEGKEIYNKPYVKIYLEGNQKIVYEFETYEKAVSKLESIRTLMRYEGVGTLEK